MPWLFWTCWKFRVASRIFLKAPSISAPIFLAMPMVASSSMLFMSFFVASSAFPILPMSVSIAVEARKFLRQKGVSARVVSVPCFELFLALPEAERRAVIGEARVKVAVEAGVRQGWDAIVGTEGGFVGMSGFGASAPYKDLYRHFGITAEKVAEAVLTKTKET